MFSIQSISAETAYTFKNLNLCIEVNYNYSGNAKFWAILDRPDGEAVDTEKTFAFDGGGTATLRLPLKFYLPGSYRLRLYVYDENNNCLVSPCPYTIDNFVEVLPSVEISNINISYDSLYFETCCRGISRPCVEAIYSFDYNVVNSKPIEIHMYLVLYGETRTYTKILTLSGSGSKTIRHDFGMFPQQTADLAITFYVEDVMVAEANKTFDFFC